MALLNPSDSRVIDEFVPCAMSGESMVCKSLGRQRTATLKIIADTDVAILSHYLFIEFSRTLRYGLVFKVTWF